MAKVNYVGVVSGQAASDELRPLRGRLRAMKGLCRPFLADTAYPFTREPEYFGLKPEQAKYGPQPDPSGLGRDGW